jgi:hypothetical protein
MPSAGTVKVAGLLWLPFQVIPTYGFGDLTTADKAVFSFYADRHCVGFEQVVVSTLRAPARSTPARETVSALRVRALAIAEGCQRAIVSIGLSFAHSIAEG